MGITFSLDREGWAKPANKIGTYDRRMKYHYFRGVDSLCCRHKYDGDCDPPRSMNKGDCNRCRKILEDEQQAITNVIQFAKTLRSMGTIA